MKKSPRQKEKEQMLISVLNKCDGEEPFVKFALQGKLSVMQLQEFRNHYVTRGYDIGYQTGYYDGENSQWMFDEGE